MWISLSWTGESYTDSCETVCLTARRTELLHRMLTICISQEKKERETEGANNSRMNQDIPAIHTQKDNRK